MSEAPIGALSRDAVRQALAGPGLRFCTGPFVFNLRSPLKHVADFIGQTYRDHRLAPDDAFVDFHARVRPVRGLRSMIRAQAVFDLDGMEPFHPLALQQAVALTEWGMNWCIYSHAHYYLIIHGAVLERDGRAVLLPAPSGSGKSTLCAALMLSGWRLLSDELIIIDPQSGHIRPVCRPVSLKNESVNVIARFSPDAEITEPIPDTSKGTVAHLKPSSESCARDREVVLPRWVVFPRYQAGSSLQVSPVSRANMFMALVENAFNYHVLGRAGFELLARVADGLEGLNAQYDDLSSVISRINELADRDR